MYLAFADTPTTNTVDAYNTDIYVMHCEDDMGTNWSQALKVNDDVLANSQFFAGIAVDQTSGRVAISWYDCRNDSQNQLTQFFAGVSGDGCTSQPRNFQLNPTASLSHQPTCSTGAADVLNYGDYTGLAFHGGYFFPTWCSFASDICGDLDTAKVRW